MLQVIEACVHECDLGAESCDDRWIRQAHREGGAAGSPVPGMMFLGVIQLTGVATTSGGGWISNLCMLYPDTRPLRLREYPRCSL